ncbi:hypothetical protein AB0P45_29315 [Streptomyces niveus]|uniref:hypothetical protein n=1 Tax=Streptomyces niveus TaxID=193462 RepID=UPI003441470E
MSAGPDHARVSQRPWRGSRREPLGLGDAISMVKAERGPTALAAGGFVLAEWRPSPARSGFLRSTINLQPPSRPAGVVSV